MEKSLYRQEGKRGENARPKISVIMGVYNGADRMDRAIASICEQSFTDWEFIICDDASTDHTWEKLVEWSNKDRRIVPIHNEKNLKLAATLNKCIQHTSGCYIARMDDDDFSYPWRFEEQNAFLDANPQYAFVSGQVDGITKEGMIENYWHRKEFPEKKDFLKCSQFIHPATVFRKEPLIKAGGYRIALETRRMEDYDLFMRLYAMGYIGYNLQRPMLQYTVDMKKTKYIHRIDEVKVRLKGFKELGLLPLGLPYVIRPLIVGLIPQNILRKIKNRKREKKQ